MTEDQITCGECGSYTFAVTETDSQLTLYCQECQSKYGVYPSVPIPEGDVSEVRLIVDAVDSP